MDFQLKISLAQISYHPAYISGGYDLLVEPFGDDSTSISKIKLEIFYELSEKLKSRYLSWLKTKVKTIVDVALTQKSDILVFPEYSIPGYLLSDIMQQIKGSNLIIIAGTHMISDKFKEVYAELELEFTDDLVCCAASPILNCNGKNHLIYKYNRSKWEGGLERPREEANNWLTIERQGKEVNLGIFICIDALMIPFHDTEKENALIVVPSWSPSTEPFRAVALQANYNELPLIYANTSLIGGSKIFAPFPEADRHWFAEKDSTKELRKQSECVMTVAVDLQNIKRNKSTVREHISAEILDISSIVYSQSIVGNEVINGFRNIESEFSEETIKKLSGMSGDELIKQKLNEVLQQKRMGILRNDRLKSLLSITPVEEITYFDLRQEQSENTLYHISNHPESFADADVLATLSTVSNMSSQIKNSQTNEPVKPTVEERPFYDRESELDKVRLFFNHPSEKLLIIQGIRGIGKTFLVEQIPKRILPPNNQWKKIQIKFNTGMGFPLFIDELAYQLSLTLRFNTYNEMEILEVVRKVLVSFEAYRAAYLIIDDFHHILDKEGSYVDLRFKTFIDEYLRRTAPNSKIILITNRNINLESQRNINNPVTLRGLKDESIEAIVDYHYKNITGRLEGVEISETLLHNLHGNPLAAVITAQYLQNHSIKSLEGTTELFRRFQEQFIANLLEEIEFKEEEKELLDFISTSKNEVHSSIIYTWKPGIYSIVDSLCSQFLLEYDSLNNTYSIHPLVRDYFYENLTFDTRLSYHQQLAQINEDVVLEIRKKDGMLPPKNISELIYHFAGSLQKDKLSQYQTYYQDELKPIADHLFIQRKYEDALDYYLNLLEISRTRRLDVIEKVFMCYGNLNKWREAKVYFEEAINIKDKVHLYAKYAELLAIKTREFGEAESWALQGEEIYLQSSSKRIWEYAKIKQTFGRIFERQGRRECLEFYKEACELDKTNVYYKFRYAKSLLHWGYLAKDIIEEGLSIKKDYKPLLSLEEGLSEEDENGDSEFGFEEEDNKDKDN